MLELAPIYCQILQIAAPLPPEVRFPLLCAVLKYNKTFSIELAESLKPMLKSDQLIFYKNFLEYLLSIEKDAGSVASTQDAKGDTPLHCAVNCGASVGFINYLLSLNARCLIANNRNEIPADRAQIAPSCDIRACLHWHVYPIKYLTDKIAELQKE